MRLAPREIAFEAKTGGQFSLTYLDARIVKSTVGLGRVYGLIDSLMKTDYLITCIVIISAHKRLSFRKNECHLILLLFNEHCPVFNFKK